MDLLDQIERTEFLGAEFLMWLWYVADEGEGTITLPDGPAEIHFDDQLVLEAHLAEAEQSRLRGGAPAYSPEAHKALQLGKQVAKAKLRLMKTEREWLFTIDAASFLMSGIKTPSVLSDDDDAKFEERMYLIEELEQAWLELYRQFLEIRLSDAWEGALGRMRAWIDRPTADEAGAR